MRRWRTALISMATMAALFVPVQTAAADPGGKPFVPKQKFVELGHSKIKPSARSAALADRTITLRAIDMDGLHISPLASIFDVTTGAEYPLTQSGDTLTGTVPDGDYSLVAIVVTGDAFSPRDLALYGNPTLTVNGDVDLTLDARTATEIKAVTPSTTATEVMSHAQLTQTIAGQNIYSSISGRPDLPIRTWPSSNTTRPYHFLYAESQSEPLGTASPRVYNLAFPTSGRIPSTLTFNAPQSSLALVNTTYNSQGVASDGVGPHTSVVAFDGVVGGLGIAHGAAAPSTQRVYYTAGGVSWNSNYIYVKNNYQIPENEIGSHRYTAGATYSETWNKAAFGPTIGVGHGEGTLVVSPKLADTSTLNHENIGGNYSDGATGTLTVYRNGQKVAESTNPMSAILSVPPEAADYQVDLAVQRTVPWSKYVKSVNSHWTFPSAERPGDPFANERNLLQPRIGGAFDTSGRAASGTTFPLDVTVQRPVDGTAVSTISLEASFDDGVTWTSVPLTANGADKWTANVTHPLTNNGFVALRFKASDASGNSVDQTVLRAYGLR